MEAIMRRTLALVLAFPALVAMAVLLGGCDTSPPTKQQVSSVDYGPKPDDYQQIIRDYLRNRFTDPTAAIIDFKAGPTQMYQKDAVVRDLQFGWAVCAMVNDKNTQGAYTGFYPAVYFIRNGNVVASNGGPGDGPIGTQFARRQCKELGYEVP
jgi:hypothetical protein